MTERMTVTEYARHRGVSRQAVYKALAARRIQRDRDGRIDAQTADRRWHELTDPFRGGQIATAPTDYPVDPVLGEQQARLARAAQAVPELARWTDFINRGAVRAVKVFQDPEVDDFTDDPLGMHEFLYDLIANYLIDTGAVDEKRIDEADSIMFPLTTSKE